MTFRFTWALALIIVHIIIWILWQIKYKKQNLILPNTSKKIRDKYFSNLDEKRLEWRNRAIAIGLFILAIAASGPQIGTRVRPVERKGIDLVIALDTSTSMDAEDVTPSRLLKAKFELGRLIRSLKGDRVAILAHNSDRYFGFLYSVSWAGAVFVPINTRLAPPEIEFWLNDSESSLLFVDKVFAPVIEKSRSEAYFSDSNHIFV